MAQIEDGLIIKISSAISNQNERMVLTKAPLFKKPEQASQEGEEAMEDVQPIIQPDEIQLYDFSKKIILKEEAITDLKGILVTASGEIDIKFVPKLVEDPPIDFLVEARVTMINKAFFDAIQEVQKDVRTATN